MYSRDSPSGFIARYRGRCNCGRVEFESSADPVDSKYCHCRDCQRLHGAPFQWACIFAKDAIWFRKGVSELSFFSTETDTRTRVLDERRLTCKVSCAHCGSIIADEGRNMMLMMGSLFSFFPAPVPKSFAPSCHIFFQSALFPSAHAHDGLSKWAEHKGKSKLIQ
jgi:hypothetical protein